MLCWQHVGPLAAPVPSRGPGVISARGTQSPEKHSAKSEAQCAPKVRSTVRRNIFAAYRYFSSFDSLPASRLPGSQMHSAKGHLQKNKDTKKQGGGGVGCFYVGLRFFGLFCKNLLHVILTPPASNQHPHDANNPQVGHLGHCEPKWWPQGSTSSSSKTKQRTHKR
jgi:hypothetical protein